MCFQNRFIKISVAGAALLGTAVQGAADSSNAPTPTSHPLRERHQTRFRGAAAGLPPPSHALGVPASTTTKPPQLEEIASESASPSPEPSLTPTNTTKRIGLPAPWQPCADGWLCRPCGSTLIWKHERLDTEDGTGTTTLDVTKEEIYNNLKWKSDPSPEDKPEMKHDSSGGAPADSEPVAETHSQLSYGEGGSDQPALLGGLKRNTVDFENMPGMPSTPPPGTIPKAYVKHKPIPTVEELQKRNLMQRSNPHGPGRFKKTAFEYGRQFENFQNNASSARRKRKQKKEVPVPVEAQKDKKIKTIELPGPGVPDWQSFNITGLIQKINGGRKPDFMVNARCRATTGEYVLGKFFFVGYDVPKNGVGLHFQWYHSGERRGDIDSVYEKLIEEPEVVMFRIPKLGFTMKKSHDMYIITSPRNRMAKVKKGAQPRWIPDVCFEREEMEELKKFIEEYQPGKDKNAQVHLY